MCLTATHPVILLLHITYFPHENTFNTKINSINDSRRAHSNFVYNVNKLTQYLSYLQHQNILKHFLTPKNKAKCLYKRKFVKVMGSSLGNKEFTCIQPRSNSNLGFLGAQLIPLTWIHRFIICLFVKTLLFEVKEK